MHSSQDASDIVADRHVDGWNDEGKVFYRKQQAAPTGDERWRIARAENGLATFVGTSKL